MNRKQLLDKRHELARQEHEALDELERKRQQIEGLAYDVKERGSTPDIEAVLLSLREEQQRILGRMEALRSRRPFLVDEASGPMADQ